TSAANVVGKVLASKRVMGAAPLRPSICDWYKISGVSPSGVMTPIPVMTTRRCMSRSAKGHPEIGKQLTLHDADPCRLHELQDGQEQSNEPATRVRRLEQRRE